ncbi:hypothetical protein KTO58_22985 [Chitinophaga pendula]|uniref:hypothetical protein n=1 Tax=Chitinophaga TaxID=79328 RepID=UPI000BAE79D3|nr:MULTISPECIES: hypothetical protein [Chitinophaga]ASZ10520.1 hypothetical protein CK934_05785 [Chitinophaga sp. MD30]UCJ06507.1 hypothetical protein KTO58_22985 [Chitinophaga pendula]
MAIKVFEIKDYRSSLSYKEVIIWDGAPVTIKGSIVCYGEAGYRFIAYFLPSGVQKPSAAYLQRERLGVVFLPIDEMVELTDLLEHGGCVYAYMDSEMPQLNYLCTMEECKM